MRNQERRQGGIHDKKEEEKEGKFIYTKKAETYEDSRKEEGKKQDTRKKTEVRKKTESRKVKTKIRKVKEKKRNLKVV